MRHRRVLAVAATVVGLAAIAPEAAAKLRAKPRSWIVSVGVPAGSQGTAGLGANVVVPFVVAATNRRPTDVEVQFGVDRNFDGQITDDEFRAASEDRLDPADTRANSGTRLFATGSRTGSAADIVWRSTADVARGRFAIQEYALTQQGRLLPDPDNPGSFLLAATPNGSFSLGGVRVRLRTKWRRTKHARLQFSPWTYSDPFDLDNASTPSMTIDSVAEGATTAVRWTAFDADSEDWNGNGRLDLADGSDGEDVNENGKLDCARMGVAFDWHRLAPGEDPAVLSDVQLGALVWIPCSRNPDSGDTDSLDARPGVPVPESGPASGVCSARPGVGRSYTFAWDAARDAGVSLDGLILRATPFCEHRKRGPTVYSRAVVHTSQ